MAEETIAQSEALYAKNDIRGNYEFLTKAFEGGQQHPDVVWRYARSCYDTAMESTDKAERQKQIEKGLALIKSAAEMQPNNFAVQKWHGILLGSLGDFLATKDKIANAFVIRDCFKKATELNPNDAASQHCLGKWCWSVLQIGWLERQAASLLFGTPPSSTYEECESHLLAAHKLNSQMVYNSLLLGDLNYQQKKYADAKQYYELAVGCPVVSENGKRQQQEAREKLAKC